MSLQYFQIERTLDLCYELRYLRKSKIIVCYSMYMLWHIQWGTRVMCPFWVHVGIPSPGKSWICHWDVYSKLSRMPKLIKHVQRPWTFPLKQKYLNCSYCHEVFSAVNKKVVLYEHKRHTHVLVLYSRGIPPAGNDLGPETGPQTMGYPPVNRHTHVKTIPSPSFACGW